jgi:hypothetical protein
MQQGPVLPTGLQGTQDFLRAWRAGYVAPLRLARVLAAHPAPHTGILAQLLRALLDSLLVYLPVALMGRTPPEPPYLRFIPAERYYAALIGLTPLVLLLDLLLTSAVIHALLRLSGYRSDFDRIVNLVGMTALIVGAVLVPWDWLWLAVGSVDQVFLGISHLVIALWGVMIMVAGVRALTGAPIWLAIVVNVLAMPWGTALRIMFMRSPL